MRDANVSKTTENPDENVRPRIYLRNKPFTIRCNVLGAITEDARAALIGMNYRALWNARQGNPVGEKFIAGTLSAFDHHAEQFAAMNLPITFEAIFETVRVPTEQAVAAGVA